MTEKELRNLVVETAKAWHGKKQSNGSHREIIDIYNSHRPRPRGYAVKYNDSWCAAYISAVGIKLGLADILFPECSCHQMVLLYKKAGRWQENDAYVPQIGDIVQYDWQDNGKGDNKGTPDHVGFVCSISGNTMQIIEGNLNYAVGYRTLKVDGKYIRGYCLPDYASKATPEPVEEVKSETTGGDADMKKCLVSLPLLTHGDTVQAVKALQSLLVLNGYKLPNFGVDGHFGDETKAAVESFQKAKKLTVDAIVGPKTWKALVG